MRRLLKWMAGIALVLLLASAALWFFLFRPPPPGSPSAPVTTTLGPVRGLESQGVTVYRGLPYAAPPVGPLRWREPQPAAAWAKMRDAFTFHRDCPQVGGPIPGTPPAPQSEDCLYLNVWAPSHSGAGETHKPLPVILWLHGGGDLNGSASAYPYWGTQFARKGVMLIAANYRLGALGFLAHPELTAESPHHASGNYGLMDILAALKWVQANARAFGGDPGNVTVMGHSAGAWNVSHLQVLPQAAGLYRRVIAMSNGDFGPAGTGEGPAPLADAEAAGVRFAQTLRAKSLTALRALPADKIVNAPVGLWRDRSNGGDIPVTLDGYIVPGDVHDAYAAGKANPVDLLTGYTALEGVGLGSPTPGDAATYRAAVQKRYGAFASSILREYPAGDDEEARKSAIRLAGEHASKWHAATWARLHVETKKGRVFFYRFSHRPGLGPFRGIGAAHGSELGYVFDFPKRGLRYGTQWPWRAWRDSALVDTIQAYWANFARTGDPNGPGLPAWPQFTGGPQLMDFAEEAKVRSWPEGEEHRLMDAYMNAVRTARDRSTAIGK